MFQLCFSSNKQGGIDIVVHLGFIFLCLLTPWAFLPTFSLSPTPALSTHNKKAANAAFLLTHLGSNQDSAEPKSDVLPITPWVNAVMSLQN
jgi:hypothetical protein